MLLKTIGYNYFYKKLLPIYLSEENTTYQKYHSKIISSE